MKELDLFILELKMLTQEEYAIALETQNINKSTFLRGKITAINEILQKMR